MSIKDLDKSRWMEILDYVLRFCPFNKKMRCTKPSHSLARASIKLIQQSAWRPAGTQVIEIL